MDGQPIPGWVQAAFERCAREAVGVAGANAFDALECVLIDEMDNPSRPERQVVSAGVMALLPEEGYGASEASQDEVAAVRELVDVLAKEIRANWSGRPPLLSADGGPVASAVYVLVTTA